MLGGSDWQSRKPWPKVTALRADRERLRRGSSPGGGRRAGGGPPADGARTAGRDPRIHPARRPGRAQLRHRSARARRRLSRWALPDGMAALQMVSSATDIAAVHECIAAVAELANTPADPRLDDQRRVDALVDICTDVPESGQFAGRQLPRPHRRRPQVQVTMPLDALFGSHSPCFLRGHGPITADQARTLAADGELRRLVYDPLSGTLLNYGRRVYQPPQQLKDHLLARDAICTAPGCRQPASRCEIDHTVPFPRGATSTDNLATLCKHHHRAKDGGGFPITRDPNGWTTWITPMGNTITTPPHRLWHPPPPPQPPPPTRAANHAPRRRQPSTTSRHSEHPSAWATPPIPSAAPFASPARKATNAPSCPPATSPAHPNTPSTPPGPLPGRPHRLDLTDPDELTVLTLR
jgi:hypothetical protein